MNISHELSYLESIKEIGILQREIRASFHPSHLLPQCSQ